MSYRERYAEIVKAGRRESKNISQKAQNAVIDTFALMDEADAEIAALTEKLRAVEAERDAARSGVKKSAEAYGALMEHAEKLRAELERKDAALKDVELAFEEARDCVLNERHELAEQGTTNDSINSVLAILDRTVGAALSRIAALTGEKK